MPPLASRIEEGAKKGTQIIFWVYLSTVEFKACHPVSEQQCNQVKIRVLVMKEEGEKGYCNPSGPYYRWLFHFIIKPV